MKLQVMLAAGVSCLAFTQVAGAQVAVAQATDDRDTVVVMAPPAATTSAGTKSDAPLIEIPQSITVITAERFNDQGAQDLEDVVRYAGNVRTEIYGVDSREDWIEGRGGNIEQYTDGLISRQGYYNAARIETFGLERVEVVRGPAGVLGGEGSIGGLVNAVTKRPQDQFGGQVGVSFGSFNRFQITGDVTGPVSDQVDYRLVGLYRDSGTQVDFVDDGRVYLAPSVTFKPGDKTTLTLLGAWQKDETGSTAAFLPHSGVALPNPNGEIPLERFTSEPGFDEFNTEQTSVTFVGEHRFNENLKLNTTARWTDGDVSYQNLFPATYLNPENPFIDADQRVVERDYWVLKTQQDTLAADTRLQAKLDNGWSKHTILAGIDYRQNNQTRQSDYAPAGPLDLFDPVYGDIPVVNLVDEPALKGQQAGFYLQDHVKLFDQFVLLGSVRHDLVDEEFGGVKESDGATTYRVGAVWLTPGGWAPYVSYSETYDAFQGVDFYGDPYDAVRGEQVEAGIKYAPRDGSYLVTASVYEIEQPNALLPDPNNPMNQIQGPAKWSGFEIEASTKVIGDIDLMANFSRAKNEGSGQTDSDTASLWGSRKFDIAPDTELQFGVGVRYVSKSVVEIADPLYITTPSVTLADAMAAWRHKDVRVTFNVTNITGERYPSLCLGSGECYIGAFRSFSVGLSRQF